MDEQQNGDFGPHEAHLGSEQARMICREKILDFLSAYHVADVKAMKSLFTKNRPVYVGTGSHEYRYGKNEILNQYKHDFEQSLPNLRVMELREFKVSVHHGLIGCLAHVDYCPEGGKVSMRMSGFLVQEADKWLWASLHFSFPSAEQSEGDSIPLQPSSPITYEALRERYGRDEVDLLWIAESEVARNAAQKGLKRRNGEPIWRIEGAGRTDYFGQFGEFDTYVTHSDVGGFQVEDVLRNWSPKLVVISGVVFPLRLSMTELDRGPGDVVVSQEILRHGNGEHRPVTSPRKLALSVHVQESIESWHYSGGDASLNFRCYEGPLLSAHQFPNGSDRDDLYAQYPESIAFELRSAGICEALSAGGVNWIVAKGTCDWGRTQPENHVLPATTVVDFMKHLLRRRNVLETLSL